MNEFEKLIIFLCSGAAKAGDKKLSYRLASRLEALGVAAIGTIQDLSAQHASSSALQKKMIFINDCRSKCVNVLTHGFDTRDYILFDVSPFSPSADFDIENYIHSNIIPQLVEKWRYSLSPLTR